MTSTTHNSLTLDYTYEEIKGRTVLIRLHEPQNPKEFIVIKTKHHYAKLKQRVFEYSRMGILDEYYLYV